ncbi:ATP-binding protein [Microvirga sp. P5_D2]
MSEPVDLPDLVKGMTNLLQGSIGPMVRIETRFPLGLPLARVDAVQLELALLNLVVNAQVAMPDGGTVTIAGREQGAGLGQTSGLSLGQSVCLSVTDSGQGMDAATLTRATEPFFTTKGGKGTGLGLSTVHGLAAQSGGRLVLKSREGESTTAEIWLPAVHAQEATPAVSTRNEGAIGLGSGIRPLTILVIDDDTLVLQNTAAMLEDLGHRVLGASSGREALNYLGRAQSVDLVITDQAMLVMTGAQLVRAVRQQWPETPVILASGYAELPSDLSPDVVRLNKPFRQDDLAQAITESMRDTAERKVVPFRSKQAEDHPK